MRASGVTPVASRMTRPKPPSAKRPRCTKCQSLATPWRAEYWHMGATTVRLRKVRPRKVSGENRSDIRGIVERGVRPPLCRKRYSSASDDEWKSVLTDACKRGRTTRAPALALSGDGEDSHATPTCF